MLQLNGHDYEIKSANVKFYKSGKSSTLNMMADVFGVYRGTELDSELEELHFYHIDGFNTGATEPKELVGRKFEWDKPSNNEDIGTLCVVEHEDVTSCILEIVEVSQDIVKFKWTGTANIFWNAEFGRHVPFVIETEAKYTVE